MKFGKQIQKRQLEVPEYAASFVNYKALKKLIKKLSATPTLPTQNDVLQAAGVTADSQAALQANKATFFFQLERELEKVNAFYIQKEAELKIRLKTLLDKKRVLQSQNHGISRRSTKFTTLAEGFQQFANDLNRLQQFIEINGTAFAKILKKWDKASKSRTKEMYLSRAVEVQPFFNAPVISELSDQATTSLQELGALAEGDEVDFDDNRSAHVLTSRHLLGTDEGDADTLLLDTVTSGNIDALRDLLQRMQDAAKPGVAADMPLTERITRAFLASIGEGPRQSIELLLHSGLVDIQSEDDINERNCLHQGAIYGKNYIVNYGISKGVDVNRRDVYGRLPLHYASMHGRIHMIDDLLNADASGINAIDHDNYTPLIRAVISGHLNNVQRLLERSASVDPTSDNSHVPLNLACKHGSVPIVELLLKHGARIVPDAEGLYPQHLVARSGHTPELLTLLQQWGADLNQIDKLYSWTPLVHAASEGNLPCLKALLQAGVNPNIPDEKDLPALYYAAWEGHVKCMDLLAPFHKGKLESPAIKSTLMPMLGPQDHSSTGPLPMSLDPDAIPILELPPPIIPLRRYGHNFLDTKTVIQLDFSRDGEAPLIFFHDSKYPAARLTISSKNSDLIPKNIMLPFHEDTRLVSFQVDNPETFSVDFDVFPTYGAKVIAKTVALPDTFRALKNSTETCCLPLFDPRLRAIGQIAFKTQVIKPFRGKPLELTDFETYWKQTSQVDRHLSTFVTGSSLVGNFVRLYVQHTSDCVPVLWPVWTVNCGGVHVPISRLGSRQFADITSTTTTTTTTTPMGTAHAQVANIANLALDNNNMADIHRILATSGLTLEDALVHLPPHININIQLIYPTPEEERLHGLSPSLDLNRVLDSTLELVFGHARQQRAESSSQAVRSVVFSSYNLSLCAALNWKQPNFPVFLCNDLGSMTPSLSSPPLSTDVIVSSGRRTASIKEVVRTAQTNNLMGLICSSRLLDMVPALVDAIKSHGLALVVDKSTDVVTPYGSPLSERLPKGVDGVFRNAGVLQFNESINNQS